MTTIKLNNNVLDQTVTELLLFHVQDLVQ